MSKLRILMLAPFPTSSVTLSGGVTAAAHYLAKALYETGEVEILAVSLGTEMSRRELPYETVTIPVGKRPLLTRFRQAVETLKSVAYEFKADHIHAHGMDAYGYVALQLSAEAIITPHGLIKQEIGMQDSIIGNIRKAFIHSAFCKNVLQNMKNAISISPFLTRVLTDNSRAQIFEIGNLVPTEFFRIERCAEPDLFLYIGRIRHLKGLATAIEAFSLIGDYPIKFIMAGEVDDRQYHKTIKSMILRNKLLDRIEMIGIQSEQELQKLIARAQALILPSLREVAPMVIAQAFAARLPVIATSVGGVPDLIGANERGTLFAPRDHLQLSKHLLGVMGGDVAYFERTVRAHDYALHEFSTDVVVSRTLTVYRRLLGASDD